MTAEELLSQSIDRALKDVEDYKKSGQYDKARKIEEHVNYAISLYEKMTSKEWEGQRFPDTRPLEEYTLKEIKEICSAQKTCQGCPLFSLDGYNYCPFDCDNPDKWRIENVSL